MSRGRGRRGLRADSRSLQAKSRRRRRRQLKLLVCWSRRSLVERSSNAVAATANRLCRNSVSCGTVSLQPPNPLADFSLVAVMCSVGCQFCSECFRALVNNQIGLRKFVSGAIRFQPISRPRELISFHLHRCCPALPSMAAPRLFPNTKPSSGSPLRLSPLYTKSSRRRKSDSPTSKDSPIALAAPLP